MEKDLQEYKVLSLTARLATALVVFEQYCILNKIENSVITEFLNYLWKWPLIDGPDQFEPWEQSRTELVNFGLGDSANKEIKAMLNESEIDENEFREIVSGIVEILWGSFWGESEDESSLQALSNVINRCKLTNLPPLTPFKFSRFTEMSGWGVKITEADRDFWRSYNKIA